MIGHDDDLLPLRRDCVFVALALWSAICIIGLVILLYSMAAYGHDIYEDLTKNTACRCGNTPVLQLCEPVVAVPFGKDAYYLPASGETIPAAWALPSPDGRFHRCTYPRNMEWYPRNKGRGSGDKGYGPGMWFEIPNNSTLDGSPATRCLFAPTVGY